MKTNQTISSCTKRKHHSLPYVRTSYYFLESNRKGVGSRSRRMSSHTRRLTGTYGVRIGNGGREEGDRYAASATFVMIHLHHPHCTVMIRYQWIVLWICLYGIFSSESSVVSSRSSQDVVRKDVRSCELEPRRIFHVRKKRLL